MIIPLQFQEKGKIEGFDNTKDASQEKHKMKKLEAMEKTSTKAMESRRLFTKDPPEGCYVDPISVYSKSDSSPKNS